MLEPASRLQNSGGPCSGLIWRAHIGDPLATKVDLGPACSARRVSEAFGCLAICAGVLFHNAKKVDPRLFVRDEISWLSGRLSHPGPGLHDSLYLQRDFRRWLLRRAPRPSRSVNS